MNNFYDIYGNEFIKDSMKNSIKFYKVSHAYIIDGQSGCGKKLIADAFAKKLQCEGSHEDGCQCVSCRTFDLGNHPDIIYIRPEKKSSIGVDDIREQVNTNIRIKPYRYQYKIFIIDKADTMTTGAQNALLKTIEEPPPYGIFILLSRNSNNFLQTILSRCVMFKVKPLSTSIIKEYLNAIGVESNLQNLIAAYSAGSIGEALKLKDDTDFTRFREEILDTICSLEKNNMAKAAEMARKLEKHKDAFADVLDILYVWYRDALLLKTNSGQELIINSDKLDEISLFSSKHSLEQLFNGSEAIFEAKINLKSNANFQMNLESLLFKITGFYSNYGLIDE